MNYGQCEVEIVEKLNLFFTSKNVENLFNAALMPESKRDFDVMINRSLSRGVVAVQYMDSIYDPSSSASMMLQEEKAKFRLTILIEKIRGPKGLYTFIDLIKTALMGYRLSGSDRISLSKYGTLEYEADVWQPYLEIDCTLYNQQQYDDLEPEIFGGNVSGINAIVTN